MSTHIYMGLGNVRVVLYLMESYIWFNIGSFLIFMGWQYVRTEREYVDKSKIHRYFSGWPF